MTEQKIDQLFKNALGNHEADVNPELWTNIEKGLQVPASGNPVSGNSSVLKSAGVLGKMSVKSLLFISGAAITIIGTIAYFVTKTPDAKHTVANPVSQTISLQSPSVTHHETPVLKDERVNGGNKVVNQNHETPETKKQQAVSVIKSNPDQSKALNEKGTPVKTLTTASPVPSAVTYPDKKPSVTNTSPVVQEASAEKQTSDPGKQLSEVKEADPVFDTIEKYLLPVDGNKRELINSFSPNGDGLNDDFMLKTTGLKSLEVIIFDRGGKEIYSWKSLNGKWDGKLRDGSEAPRGNYFYSVNAETLEGKICIGRSSLILTGR